MGSADWAIPKWVRIWLMITTVVCIVDGSFCILRPHSLPDGVLFPFFYIYKYYIIWDLHYADTSDSFVFSQGLANIVECVVNLIVIFNLLKSVRLNKLLAIVASTMTCWKTVIFCIYSCDIPKGGHDVTSWLHEFLVFGPAVIWIILPGYAAYVLAMDFANDGKEGFKRSTRARGGSDVTDGATAYSPTRYNLRKPKST